MLISIYTDGSIVGNGSQTSLGGWAAIIRQLDENGQEIRRKEIWGKHANTTNNEMELAAVYKALKELNPRIQGKARVIVVSDSQYVVNTFSKWVYRWKKEGWKNRPNLRLIQAIHELSSAYNVEFRWVKGHAADPLNNQVDELARKARVGEI